MVNQLFQWPFSIAFCMFTRGYSTPAGAYFAGGLLHVCIIQPYQVINPKVCILMGWCQPKFSWWFDSPLVNTHLELQRESVVRVSNSKWIYNHTSRAYIPTSSIFWGKKPWLKPWLYLWLSLFLVAPLAHWAFPFAPGSPGTGIYTESPGFIPAPWWGNNREIIPKWPQDSGEREISLNLPRYIAILKQIMYSWLTYKKWWLSIANCSFTRE